MPNEPNQPIAVDSTVTVPPTTANNPDRDKSKPVPMVLKLLRFAFRVGGYLSPSTAGRLAYKLWFTPTRFKPPASERNTLASAEIKHLEINNHRIATYRWGRMGPTVLLVHGWSGRGTQLGSFAKPLIEAGYRVLSFDAPAHGKSSGKQTNLFEVADVIVALQQCHGSFDSVITHSFGGPCVAIAVQRGFKIRRIVSISPPATTIGLVEKFISVLHIPEKAGKNLIQRIETTFGRRIWDDISMINSVKDLHIPGMLIHDSNDVVIPWQEGHAVAQAWNNANFIKTSGLGHRRILRDTSVIESAVRFINER